jgi:hypothetical protein
MQMGLSTLENSKKTFRMDLARRLNLMGHSMWGSFLKGCSKAKESSSGLMESNMKDNGKQMR